MMTNGKRRPRRMRGSVAGNLPLWLAATATAVGFLYLLVRDDTTRSSGTPEEIAERVKPVGRVVLAAPAEPTKASHQATSPASAGTESKEAQVAEPVQDAEASASPESQPGSEAAGTAPAASAPSAALPEPTAASGAAASLAVTPAVDDAAGAGADAPDASVAAKPPERRSGHAHVKGPGVDASPTEGFPPGPAHGVSPRPAGPPVHAPLPARRLPEAESGMPPAETPDWQPQPPTYRMIWVRRYDLPGQPFELRPAPPEGR